MLASRLREQRSAGILGYECIGRSNNTSTLEQVGLSDGEEFESREGGFQESIEKEEHDANWDPNEDHCRTASQPSVLYALGGLSKPDQVRVEDRMHSDSDRQLLRSRRTIGVSRKDVKDAVGFQEGKQADYCCFSGEQ